MGHEGNKVRRKYQRVAKFYDLLDMAFEYRRYAALRKLLFDRAEGDLLDAGVGTGRNMPFYPPNGKITGIDLSGAMLERAQKRGAHLGVSLTLLERDVLETKFPNNHFDTIVSSFLFCVLDETQQLPALLELRRICKPGGTIRILEYSLSQKRFKRFVMRLWAPWVSWAYGASFTRNTEKYLSQAGLELVEHRFVFHDIIKLIIVRA